MLRGQHQCPHQTGVTQSLCGQQATRPGNLQICLLSAACGPQGFWTLWGDSGSCSSISTDVVLGNESVYCSTCFLFMQPILVWWILRNLKFMLIVLQKQIALIISSPLTIFSTGKYVPPPRHPWGYLSEGLFVALCRCPLMGAAVWGANSHCSSCHLQSSLCFLWSSSSLSCKPLTRSD